MGLHKDELIALISAKRDIFKAKTEDLIINTDIFKQLISIAISFADTTSVKAFAFHITESDIPNLDFSKIQDNLKSKVLPELKLKNFFVVDHEFEISTSSQHNPASSIEAKETYKVASQNNHIVLLIFNKTYALFYNGIETTNTTFNAEADLKKYVAKRDITELFDVINEYKLHIKSKEEYYKFFADKPTLVRIFGDPGYIANKNLLRNKPEVFLRDDLKHFLRDNINRSFNFSKESMLDSDKRLDINTEDELGNYYFLEIKWVGVSLKPDATGAGYSFGDDRPQEGFKQTLEYIAELNAMKKTVKLGCLIVFDARDIKTPFVYDINVIDGSLHAHEKCYHCIDDLHLENTVPR